LIILPGSQKHAHLFFQKGGGDAEFLQALFDDQFPGNFFHMRRRIMASPVPFGASQALEKPRQLRVGCVPTANASEARAEWYTAEADQDGHRHAADPTRFTVPESRNRFHVLWQEFMVGGFPKPGAATGRAGRDGEN
jgi:hypothetical protein